MGAALFSFGKACFSSHVDGLSYEGGLGLTAFSIGFLGQCLAWLLMFCMKATDVRKEASPLLPGSQKRSGKGGSRLCCCCMDDDGSVMDETPIVDDFKVQPAQWAIVYLLITISLLSSVISMMVAPFLPTYCLDRGLNYTWVGQMYGAHSFAMLVATLISPALLKFVSNITAVLMGCWMIFGGCILSAIVPPLTEGTELGVIIILLKAIMGFGEGMSQVATLAIIFRTAPERDIPMLSGATEGMRALGILIGLLLGGPLYEAGGWALPFLTMGVAFGCAVLTLTVVTWMVPPIGQYDSKSRIDATDLLCRAPTAAVIFTIFLVIVPVSLLEPGLSPYMEAAPFNLSPSGVGVLFGVSAVADMAAAVLAGPLTPLLGHFALIALCCVLLVSGSLLLSLGPQAYGVVIFGIVLLSFGIYPVVISCMTLLMRVCRTYGLDAREYSEIIAAITGSAFGLGMALSNSIGGHILDRLGFQRAFLVAGSVVVAIPFVLGLGFSSWAIGRPLAPMADLETELTLASKKDALLTTSQRPLSRVPPRPPQPHPPPGFRGVRQQCTQKDERRHVETS